MSQKSFPFESVISYEQKPLGLSLTKVGSKSALTLELRYLKSSVIISAYYLIQLQVEKERQQKNAYYMYLGILRVFFLIVYFKNQLKNQIITLRIKKLALVQRRKSHLIGKINSSRSLLRNEETDNARSNRMKRCCVI